MSFTHNIEKLLRKACDKHTPSLALPVYDGDNAIATDGKLLVVINDFPSSDVCRSANFPSVQQSIMDPTVDGVSSNLASLKECMKSSLALHATKKAQHVAFANARRVLEAEVSVRVAETKLLLAKAIEVGATSESRRLKGVIKSSTTWLKTRMAEEQLIEPSEPMPLDRIFSRLACSLPSGFSNASYVYGYLSIIVEACGRRNITVRFNNREALLVSWNEPRVGKVRCLTMPVTAC